MRRTGFILAFIASIQIMGGHWAVLQAVAWMGMAVEYSRTVGWEKGLEQTFDGQHPCPLCKKVAKGRAQEDKPASKALELKLNKKSDVCHEVTAIVPVLTRATDDREWPGQHFGFEVRPYLAPTPPPRLA